MFRVRTAHAREPAAGLGTHFLALVSCTYLWCAKKLVLRGTEAHGRSLNQRERTCSGCHYPQPPTTHNHNPQSRALQRNIPDCDMSATSSDYYQQLFYSPMCSVYECCYVKDREFGVFTWAPKARAKRKRPRSKGLETRSRKHLISTGRGRLLPCRPCGAGVAADRRAGGEGGRGTALDRRAFFFS